MKKINWFYITIIMTGIFLFVALRPSFHKELSFYGFAESRSTEINYNYAVVVDKILVKAGQEVKAGQVLMQLSRRKSKETLEDQSFRVAQLQAEEKLWKQKQKNEIEELKINQQIRLSEIERKIDHTQKELAYKKSLIEGLQSIEPEVITYRPLENALTSYEQEKEELNRIYTIKIKGLEEELNLGKNPYSEQIRRLIAEQEFDESQKHIPIVVKAPTDGLVGTISCKEEEHIPSFSSLLTFYEPHSGIIEGYVHEDLTLEVKIGQTYTIASLKDEQIKCTGKVIGLGSRIVEIPSRLRKIETVKAYGREVLIEVPKDNYFLQKEKVSITYLLRDKIN
ncbi:MAG: biotin/lipoyl-binding protein [Saprospiraceae bacterium]